MSDPLPATVAAGDVVHVQVRDRRLAARIVKPPFVREGKVLSPTSQEPQ